MKDVYDDVYQEMVNFAIKKHKNHQLLIAKEVKQYIQRVRLESEGSEDLDNYGSEDIFNDSGSMIDENQYENQGLLQHMDGRRQGDD